jgi:hypothetical protein
MAKTTTTRDFGEQATDNATLTGARGMDLMRTFAEQSLNLSKAALEGYLTTTRKTAESINHHAAEIRQRSISLASEALSDSFDFANRVVQVREPQEVLALQSEFLSRQTQALADQAKEVTQILVQGANAALGAAAEPMRRAAE